MTEQKLLSAAALASEVLRAEWPEVSPARLPAETSDSTEEEDVAHLQFMCQEIPKLLDQCRREKAMRWLGFVQGTLWAKRYVTIADLKDANRSDDQS